MTLLVTRAEVYCAHCGAMAAGYSPWPWCSVCNRRTCSRCTQRIRQEPDLSKEPVVTCRKCLPPKPRRLMVPGLGPVEVTARPILSTGQCLVKIRRLEKKDWLPAKPIDKT